VKGEDRTKVVREWNGPDACSFFHLISRPEMSCLSIQKEEMRCLILVEFNFSCPEGSVRYREKDLVEMDLISLST
jgi:hypothetical protein